METQWTDLFPKLAIDKLHEILGLTKLSQLKKLDKENLEDLLLQDLWNNHFQLNISTYTIFFILKWENIYNIVDHKWEPALSVDSKNSTLSLGVKSELNIWRDSFSYNEKWKIELVRWYYISIYGNIYDEELNYIWKWLNEKVPVTKVCQNWKKVEGVVNRDFKNGIFTQLDGHSSYYIFDIESWEVQINAVWKWLQVFDITPVFLSGLETYIFKWYTETVLLWSGLLVNWKIKYFILDGKELNKWVTDIDLKKQVFEYKGRIYDFEYNKEKDIVESSSQNSKLNKKEQRKQDIFDRLDNHRNNFIEIKYKGKIFTQFNWKWAYFFNTWENVAELKDEEIILELNKLKKKKAVLGYIDFLKKIVDRLISFK